VLGGEYFGVGVGKEQEPAARGQRLTLGSVAKTADADLTSSERADREAPGVRRATLFDVVHDEHD
jgi:hypothetical protein